MNEKLTKLISGNEENHVLPFFWMHGEDEATLRKYMKVISSANCHAVCVESRPHPDFCGPGWWHDMDIILDEARKRDMKVWILDDSHFPTGYANGALKEKPASLHRQSITLKKYTCNGGDDITFSANEVQKASPYEPSGIESLIMNYMGIDTASFIDWGDDRCLGIYAVRTDGNQLPFSTGSEQIDLKPLVRKDGTLSWNVPEGVWNIYFLHLTRNRGPHREYINMMDRSSVRVLIDTVYETHYEHYKDDFGKTIAGFFSDEPELGNGHLYETDCALGCSMQADFPWSSELEEILKETLGSNFPEMLPLLWEDQADKDQAAYIRFAYMDTVTKLVERDFSCQIGDWCRSHNVRYIGHMVEDNNLHARTGSSLGHYFRGLAGQDMAGIDDIGGQVLPQQEDFNEQVNPISFRDGNFYHYMLGKLAGSAAAIDPSKKGNSMCEIFGNYGWSEGVRLEKYLVDHFLVRGINHFVPHAFSPAPYPDPDCPPHFYAHGHNPQYRHFGCLMAYANRVCSLISNGRHVAKTAVLYHGENEWMGKTDYSQIAGRVLTDAQIEFDYIPQDIFADKEYYHTVIADGELIVNTQHYSLFLIPETEYITEATARGIVGLLNNGVSVAFIGSMAKAIGNLPEHKLPPEISGCDVVSLDYLAAYSRDHHGAEILLTPSDDRIRYYHYLSDENSSIYLFVNEGTKCFNGFISLPEQRKGYLYDAWENQIFQASYDGKKLHAVIEPLKSLILIIDSDKDLASLPVLPPTRFDCTSEIHLCEKWSRSLCPALSYPDFQQEVSISLPDHLAEDKPDFSGFVRYENYCDLNPIEGSHYYLVIEDAYEGVELFINGQSLGIQIAPPMRYEVTQYLQSGRNQICIEIATTLEREVFSLSNSDQTDPPATLSGLTGMVKIFES